MDRRPSLVARPSLIRDDPVGVASYPEALPKANCLTLDEVRARISGHLPLEECLESALAPVPQPNPRHPLALKRARKRNEWIDWVRRHADALACGQGPPRLYHDVASAYLGVNRSVRGDTPEERVRSLFHGDEELLQGALSGLRRMARRTGLPALDDLVRLDEDEMVSYFVLPLLAGLEEKERTTNRGRARLEGEVLQRALGSFYLARDYDGPEPAWYRRALHADPLEVADAFVRVYGSRIRRSSGVDRHLRALTHDESHAEVARAALPRLLKSFPAKATAEQVLYLDHLIPAALEHVDRHELDSIVPRKLRLASLRIGHRLRWLATGMLLGDAQLAVRLDRFLSGGSDARVRELAAFLMVPAVAIQVRSLSPGSLAMLVSRLGRYSGVRVDSEVRHAGGTRADLQVSFRGFAVPIETRLSSSRDLWTAVMAQLIPRDARDPRSDGYGIYVVFWHGPEHARIPSPTGKPPRTPGELQDRLTQRLTTEARRKVSVIVLDVSPP